VTRPLLTLLALLLLLPAFAVIDPAVGITAHSGVVELRGAQTWLKADPGYELRLLLAPASLLDSLGLVLASGDTLLVEGVRSQDLLLVSQIWTSSADGPLILRDLEGGSLSTGGTAAYRVDGQTCIGCRLCLAPCPTGAITFRKGKAHIDPNTCTECGICVEGNGRFKGCPVGAIKTE